MRQLKPGEYDAIAIERWVTKQGFKHRIIIYFRVPNDFGSWIVYLRTAAGDFPYYACASVRRHLEGCLNVPKNRGAIHLSAVLTVIESTQSGCKATFKLADDDTSLDDYMVESLNDQPMVRNVLKDKTVQLYLQVASTSRLPHGRGGKSNVNRRPPHFTTGSQVGLVWED